MVHSAQLLCHLNIFRHSFRNSNFLSLFCSITSFLEALCCLIFFLLQFIPNLCAINMKCVIMKMFVKTLNKADSDKQ